jgi:peptide/nickel transport system permease protein
MLRFVVRRLLLLVPILLGLSILIFFWVRALPGSPAESLLGERATPALVKAYRERYGLDKPLLVQYASYVKTTASMDFGVSIATRRKVTEELKQRFPATIELTLAAMLVAVSIGIPLGFLAAKRHGGVLDHASLFASLLGISIPIFFLAIILKYIFGVRLGWLPTVGRIDVAREVDHPTNFYVLDAILTRDWGTLWDVLKHLVLPAIALGSIPLAIIARITRAAVLDVQNEDYVRTARAKGLAPLVVDSRHVLRNALLPVSTIIGLQTGLLLSGAILTETVFAFPGMGSWLRAAIENRDYPVLQGGILFLAIVFVLVNLVVDISYAIINPRLRHALVATGR